MSPYHSDRQREAQNATKNIAHGPHAGANGRLTSLSVVPADDADYARVIVELVRGRSVSREVLASLPAVPVDWSGLANVVNGTAALDQRAAEVRRWLDGLESYHPADVVAEIRRAYQEAEERPPGEEGATQPRPFSLDLINSADFFAEVYRLEWHIRGLMVKGQSAVFGGPQKSLKTSILIDWLISLASGTRFLGRFEVPTATRAALISGESGRMVIQANAKQICIARGIPYSDVDKAHWGFALPQLTNAEHLKTLRKTISDLGLEAIALDPLYLALLAGGSNIDPNDMFQMGPLLNDVANTCLDGGCTPLLAHHFVKNRLDPFGPPDMSELAHAGIGQAMRQWMLVSRREKYDAEIGIHRLHFNYGGSAGHSGELQIDIETGRIAEDLNAGRKWSVTVLTPTEGRVARQEQAQSEKQRRDAEKKAQQEQEKENSEREAMQQAIKAFRKEGNRKLTAKKLRTATGWRAEKADRILFRLAEDGFIRSAQVPVDMGNGTTKDHAGYELIEEGRIAS